MSGLSGSESCVSLVRNREDFSTYEDLNKYEDLKKAGIHNQNTIKFTLAAHAWRYMLGGMRLTASMVHMIETPAFQGFQLNELLGTDPLMTRNTSQKVKPHAFAFWAAFLYCSPFGDYISPGKAVVCVSARQSCSFCLSLLTVQLGLRMLPQKVRPIAEAREKVPSRAEELGHCRGGTWPSQDSHCLHLYIAQLCTVLPCCRREPRAMWLRRQHTLLHLTRSSARRCDIIKRITDGITSPDNTEEKQT